jgi:hypothetical protein
MDAFWIFVGKVGGLAAIGAVIDFLMSRKQKRQLNDWLSEWWVRFDDVRVKNFGRVEAELAISILDRYAGRSLWSRQRWLAVFYVSAAAYCFAVVWCFVRSVLTVGADRGVDIAVTMALNAGTEWFALNAWQMMLGAIIAFALSLSVTRGIALVAARACRGTVTTVLSFALLLFVHVLLLLYWTSFSMLVLVALNNFPIDLDDPWKGIKNKIDFVLSVYPSWAEQSWRMVFGPLYFDSHYYMKEPLVTVLFVFKSMLDILANGLRIAFALVFLGSYLFRPLIQAPLSLVWERIVSTEKPFFATTFGIVAAIWTGVAALV